MNPQKQSKKIELDCQHRLIIIVFIPSLEGYYKNVLEVFKLCLESAISTTNSNCAITVVNNASCEEVNTYLKGKLDDNSIDTVIHHKKNIGKIDALIGAARGSREPIITIADVDILFTHGWQKGVEDIFEKFKGVASVSPIPARMFKNYETYATFEKILRGKVKYKSEAIPENHEDYNRYLVSTHNDEETDEMLKWPVVTSNGQKAIIGSGHQILCMRRELFFSTVPFEPSLTLVGNRSEYHYCDDPINYSGGMRLATFHNMAYHMGNTVEDWMRKVQQENISKEDQLKDHDRKLNLPVFRPKTPNRSLYKLRKRVANRLFKWFYN